ncbi:hypothetical protein CROQUDRAFT_106414 [Cronartium quercuum f. sp. fusiforme G11]|uniref:Uncharacterized protein n=1 Tax=Cronartium quercuum f. sp. fusiforme G11 TaxID=708437 RepID=A0A9P6NNU6_9BASI|nr:hypothetical protein CROQUDRAFT_106414 [Cronartium quercuum f. sp. fusiforme G11]
MHSHLSTTTPTLSSLHTHQPALTDSTSAYTRPPVPEEPVVSFASIRPYRRAQTHPSQYQERMIPFSSIPSYRFNSPSKSYSFVEPEEPIVTFSSIQHRPSRAFSTAITPTPTTVQDSQPTISGNVQEPKTKQDLDPTTHHHHSRSWEKVWRWIDGLPATFET